MSAAARRTRPLASPTEWHACPQCAGWSGTDHRTCRPRAASGVKNHRACGTRPPATARVFRTLQDIPLPLRIGVDNTAPPSSCASPRANLCNCARLFCPDPFLALQCDSVHLGRWDVVDETACPEAAGRETHLPLLTALCRNPQPAPSAFAASFTSRDCVNSVAMSAAASSDSTPSNSFAATSITSFRNSSSGVSLQVFLRRVYRTTSSPSKPRWIDSLRKRLRSFASA